MPNTVPLEELLTRRARLGGEIRVTPRLLAAPLTPHEVA